MFGHPGVAFYKPPIYVGRGWPQEKNVMNYTCSHHPTALVKIGTSVNRYLWSKVSTWCERRAQEHTVWPNSIIHTVSASARCGVVNTRGAHPW
jgi:hypothetical protein